MSADHHETMPSAHGQWSKHRIEALTDGIFAVVMTLLVIELKVPDPHTIHSQDALVQALVDVAPKLASWLLSFYVLATFWIGNHRLYHYVRSVDKGLVWRSIHQLTFVSLMPFSAALLGEYPGQAFTQVAYNGNMVFLALLGLWTLRYLRKHPELTGRPLEGGTYHAMLVRLGGLVACGLVAMLLALWFRTQFATLVYLAMIAFGLYGSRLERAQKTATDTRAPSVPTAQHRP